MAQNRLVLIEVQDDRTAHDIHLALAQWNDTRPDDRQINIIEQTSLIVGGR